MTISSVARRNFIRVFKVPSLLLIQCKGGAAIHAVAFFRSFAANRPFFAVADGHHAVCGYALRGQKFFDGIGAPIAEAEVVFFASALIAVAFDGEADVWVRFEPGGVGLKSRNLVGFDVGLVVI